jgi:hypothetical protein
MYDSALEIQKTNEKLSQERERERLMLIFGRVHLEIQKTNEKLSRERERKRLMLIFGRVGYEQMKADNNDNQRTNR